MVLNLGSRLLKASGIIGSAHALSAATTEKGKLLQAYYGEESYTDRFGTSVESRAGVYEGVGLAAGILAGVTNVGFGTVRRASVGLFGLGKAGMSRAVASFRGAVPGAAGTKGGRINPSLKRLAGGATLFGAPFAAGAAVGSNTPRGVNVPAEGNFTSITRGSNSVRRMNYSTAGLVQALHNSRRTMP